jgi:F0F1-type ATP synthase assembly protein I
MQQQPAPSPPPAPGRELGVGYKYVSLGCTFAGGIVLFMAGGWALDRWLRLTPLFTIGGTLVGAVLSFLHVYWRLASETRRGGDGPE